MIQRDVGIAKIFITDDPFGHVTAGDPTFRTRFEKEYGFSPQQMVWMNQTHSNNVRFVDELSEDDMLLADTDGVVTRRKDVMLITKTADCVPILLWNEKDHAIAALHCGWKGFLQGIIESFAKLCDEKEIDVSHFSAFLGPHLRKEDFEVQQDFVEQVPEDKQGSLFREENKTFFDITQGVLETLNKIGINDVQDSGINTYNDPAFFSYRQWSHTPEEKRDAEYCTFANAIYIPHL